MLLRVWQYVPFWHPWNFFFVKVKAFWSVLLLLLMISLLFEKMAFAHVFQHSSSLLYSHGKGTIIWLNEISTMFFWSAAIWCEVVLRCSVREFHCVSIMVYLAILKMICILIPRTIIPRNGYVIYIFSLDIFWDWNIDFHLPISLSGKLTLSMACLFSSRTFVL